MKSLLFLLPCFAISAFIAFSPSENKPSIHTDLVWSDEFNESGLPDPSIWTYDVGKGCDLPCGCGWGNNELQYYTDADPNNIRVEDGNLVIRLVKDKNKQYTSAKIHTKKSASWKYGTIEVRAKTAKGLGAWSAIWMMPTESKYGGWPRSGEIDIMEQVGYEPDSVWSAAHVEKYNGMKGTHKNGLSYVPNISNDFHVFKLVWTENGYETYVDDKLNFTYVNEQTGIETWPFDQEFHLILNLAYGGNWGGKNGIDDDALPMEMMVDYIRVYQNI